jgi:hypothetical protein
MLDGSKFYATLTLFHIPFAPPHKFLRSINKLQIGDIKHTSSFVPSSFHPSTQILEINKQIADWRQNTHQTHKTKNT